MTQTTNFEVQVQKSGQWTIHENFKGHQRDAAIAEAKNILTDVEGVKVVKEVLDPETGVFNDSVIFKEINKKRIAAAKKAKALRRAGARGGYSRPAGSTKRSGKKPTSSTKSVVVKLLLVVLVSLCLSAAFAVGATEILGGKLIFGVRFTGSTESNLLIGVFIVTFLISAPVLAMFFMRGESLQSSSKGKLGSLLALAVHRMAKPQAAAKKSAKNRAASTPTPSAPEPSAQVLSEAEKQAKAAEDKATDERLQAELEKEKEKEKEEPAAEESAEEPAPEPEAEAKPEDSEQAQALSPEAENLKAYMLEFLNQSLKGTQADVEKMDSFNKFGVSLYMAGACEILSQKGNMDPLSRTKILAESVQVMGFKKSHASSFADRYEEYLMADARYMQMFQAGRNAINIYLAEESAGPRLLDNAIAEWNKPKTVEEQSGPVTVLFTDIVGSTAMTQAMGDAGAQKVVRAHNRIVREALSANAGNEVKHTGDGIMASFTKTANGVDASIQMQRETAIHNQNNPDLPLHLKIGLNAGEPIAEDNDLFGTVVQLAARIVDKASADQIFISELVRGLSAGKNYQFISQGGFEMKGFNEEIVIHEVAWKEDGAEGGEAPSPPAAAPAEAPQAAQDTPPQPAAGTEPAKDGTS